LEQSQPKQIAKGMKNAQAETSMDLTSVRGCTAITKSSQAVQLKAQPGESAHKLILENRVEMEGTGTHYSNCHISMSTLTSGRASQSLQSSGFGHGADPHGPHSDCFSSYNQTAMDHCFGECVAVFE
jgi:hypothetical protein